MFKILLYNVFLYTFKQFFYSIISLKDIPLYLNKTKIYIYIYIYNVITFAIFRGQNKYKIDI